jgi:DNA-binding CsgD family transcriptional regulator/Tfp pilus assembly protein PilF
LDGPVVVLLEGESGIGKTALWTEAVHAAIDAELRVLRARPSEPEQALPFASLGDLLDPVADEVLPELPDPQRRALEAVLLRSHADDAGMGSLLADRALLAAIRALVAGGPLLVAVDDLQWVDPPSARALSFAVRRLESEPVAFLVCVRADEDRERAAALVAGVPEDRVERIPLGPLDVAAVDELLRLRGDPQYPPPTLARIHQQSGGRPMYVIEIASALRASPNGQAAGGPLPIPRSLRELLRDRLGALGWGARSALLAVATMARPTRALAEAAGGPEAVKGLDEAIAQRILAREGEDLQFTHPAFAAVVVAEAPPGEVAAMHRTLADLVKDPVERGRHLALGTQAPDDVVADEVEGAARLARERGAPDLAADLVEHAVRLTPADRGGLVLRREVLVGDLAFEAGETGRARSAYERALAGSPPGPERADVHRRLGLVLRREESYRAASDQFQLALNEPGDDLSLRFRIREDLAWSALVSGEIVPGAANARAAREIAEELGDPAMLAEALATISLAEAMRGRGIPDDLVRRAQLLRERARAIDPGMSRVTMGLALKAVEDIDAAQEEFRTALDQAIQRGDQHDQPFLLWQLSELETRAGSWAEALADADRGLALARQMGQDAVRAGLLYAKALVLAHQGRVDAARELAVDGMALAEASGGRMLVINHTSVLGFIELSCGNPEGTHELLGPLADLVLTGRLRETALARFLPDEIEALIALTKLDLAERLIDDLGAQGKYVGRTWALASAARCRGLLLGAQTKHEAAMEAFAEALALHETLGNPFGEARTQLAQGEVLRRARQRRDARLSMEAALAVFRRLGATLWEARTLGELDRLGRRKAASGQLTITEAKVADLVVEGLTNREIAGRLFLSVRTVDANLERAFHKLGVKNKAGLAVKWAEIRRKQREEGGSGEPLPSSVEDD